MSAAEILRFSADGAVLVGLGSLGGDLRAWEAATGREIARAIVETSTSTLLEPLTGGLMTLSSAGRISLWDAHTLRAVTSMPNCVSRLSLVAPCSQDYHAARFSPDGTRLAASGHGRDAWLWKAGDSSPPRVLGGHDDTERIDLSFSADGRLLVTRQPSAFRLWDAWSGRRLAVLPAPPPADSADRVHLGDMALHPSGELLVAEVSHLKPMLGGGRALTPVRNELVFWHLPTGRHHTVVCERGASNLVFSPDGTALLVDFHDKLGWWNVRESRFAAETDLADTPLVATGESPFSPTGDRCAFVGRGSGGHYEGVHLFEAPTGRPIDLPGADGRAGPPVFSSDGRYLAAGDGEGRVWDARAGELLGTLVAPDDEVGAVAFAPGRPLLTASCHDERIRMWRLDR